MLQLPCCNFQSAYYIFFVCFILFEFFPRCSVFYIKGVSLLLNIHSARCSVYLNFSDKSRYVKKIVNKTKSRFSIRIQIFIAKCWRFAFVLELLKSLRKVLDSALATICFPFYVIKWLPVHLHSHIKLGVFSIGYSTVWWILAMGLADLLGIADLHCKKVESTKWLKHKLRYTIGGWKIEQTDGRSGFPYLWGLLGDAWYLSCGSLGVGWSSLAMG